LRLVFPDYFSGVLQPKNTVIGLVGYLVIEKCTKVNGIGEQPGGFGERIFKEKYVRKTI